MGIKDLCKTINSLDLVRAIIMALGGLISMLDKRYRIKKIKAPLLVTGSLATYGVNEVAIEQAISVSTMSTLKEK